MMTDKDKKMIKLVKLVKKGKRPFEAIYDALLPAVIASAARILGSYEDARDVASKTMQKVFDHHLKDVSFYRNPYAWTFLVTRRECYSALRKRKAEGNMRMHLVGTEDESSTREFILDEEEWQLALRDCLMRLRSEWRDVVVKRFYEERRFEDISKEMFLALGTIHKRLKKGLEELRRCLKKKGVLHVSTNKTTTNGLLKADARRLIEGIAEKFKKTATCLSIQAIAEADKADGLTEIMMKHIRSCQRCRMLAEITGHWGTKAEEFFGADAILATYLRNVADKIMPLDRTQGGDRKAVGYYMRQKGSESDKAAKERYTEELMGLIDHLLDERTSIKSRTRLIAQLCDIAGERGIGARKRGK